MQILAFVPSVIVISLLLVLLLVEEPAAVGTDPM
jgi:hypothetical protein